MAPQLRACYQAQGRLLGMVGAQARDERMQSQLDALLSNIITSSAIEGERLNVGSVRASLARRLGVAHGQASSTRGRAAWRGGSRTRYVVA